MMQPKDLVLATLRHEKTEQVPWVPFAGVHAGLLLGYDAEEVLTDGNKLLASLLEVNKLYRPCGQPVVFDLQLEAEIFGAVMQFARTGAPGWAASTEDVEQTMLFGPQSRLVQNHDHALIEALAPFTDLRMKKATRAGGQIQH